MMELNTQTNELKSNQLPIIPVETPHKVSSGSPSSAKKISVDVYTLIQNANVLIKHSEFRLAVQLLRQALQRDSANPVILRPMAQALNSLSRFEEAEKILEVLCKQESTFSNLYMKATNLYKLGRDSDALQAYFEALALVVDDLPELFEVHKNMGNIFVRQGDFESAEENYNKAYTRVPDSDVLLVNYGTLEVQKGDLDKALFCFRKAVQVNSTNDRAWVGLGMVHWQFSDMELAWGNLIKASDINPLNRTALLLLAQWSSSIQKSGHVIDRLCHYSAEHPDDSEMSILLIKIFLECGEDSKAQLEFMKAFCFHPENPELKKLSSYFQGSQEHR